MSRLAPIKVPDRSTSPNPPSPLENEGLLSGNGKAEADSMSLPAQNRRRRRECGLLTWAVVATVGFVVLIVITCTSNKVPYLNYKESSQSHVTAGARGGKKNLIFMVSDGMGPASITMTRNYVQHFSRTPEEPFGRLTPLRIDANLVGTSRTRSTSSFVTDSAAGATAFSCGIKSYNGAISVLDDHLPCGTVLEAAKLAGYKTGLVVTTRITDATPATFASHVTYRSQEDTIAEHLLGIEHPLGNVVDLFLGGGACHFLPNSTETSCRADDVDLFKYAEKKLGYNVLREVSHLRSLPKNPELPILGLFAPTDIPYEIDRVHVDEKYPSLVEMTKVALDALSHATKDSDKGFFLLVEGSRIDHAGHENDPATQVREVLAYDEAMQAVKEFIDANKDDSVMIATSDHETGGLTLARQVDPVNPEYLWYPEVLANSSFSASHTASEIARVVASGKLSDTELANLIQETAARALGVKDITETELDELVTIAKKPVYAAQLTHRLGLLISVRAHIGWTTHGHSAIDVNIYGYPRSKAEPLFGNHENTEVGKFLSSHLNVDVQEITAKLRNGREWKVNNERLMASNQARASEGDHSNCGSHGRPGQADHYQEESVKYAKQLDL